MNRSKEVSQPTGERLTKERFGRYRVQTSVVLSPAIHLERRVPGMQNKGRVQIGADADLVLFDPNTVMGRATYREPTLPPVGIAAVLVGGVSVVREGVVQDSVFPGRTIRGPKR